MYLLARITDYSRELQFWRDTIRKVLYGVNFDEKSVDDIISNVSLVLKTYTTQEVKVDFEVVRELAERYKKEEPEL